LGRGSWLKASAVPVDTGFVRGVSMLAWIALAAVLMGGATACASSRSTDRGHEMVVRVKERDFRIRVRPTRFEAGKVRFVVENAGPVDHEMIIVRKRRNAIPLRADELTVDEEALDPTVATLEPAGPGSTREVRLNLPKGSYEIFCNMAGHYLGGMRAFFVVT
jgi:uncharacterized cupredoxin-like copper-binding protein